MTRIIFLLFLLLLSSSSLYPQGSDQASIQPEPQPCSDPFAVSGTKEVVVVHSPGLENNLLRDSYDRPVSIYLPPGYESTPTNRYPVIYFLHGYTGDHNSFFGDPLPATDFKKILDKLFGSGAIPPVIVVSPNSHNKYRGSFYTNSFVTGQWEDFIVKDVVDYMETNYRTIPSRQSRGIAGHSMGGYGTITLAMRNPDIFSAAYMLSAAALDLGQYAFGQFQEENESLEEAVNATVFDGLSMYAQTLIGMAAAFAPDSAASPFLGQLPVDTSGSLIDTVWQDWLQHDPSTMLPLYRDNLLQYKAIQFDCGTSDRFYFYNHNESFSDSLNKYGIEHVYESYEGKHADKLDIRIETRLLPFFFENLEHEVPGIIRNSPWNLGASDTLLIEIDLDGTVYIVPYNTPAVLDSIIETQLLSVSASANSNVKISLSEIEYREYYVYGVNENSTGISLPVPFAVVPFFPEITIVVKDLHSGDPLADCALNVSGTQYNTDAAGQVSFTGCGPNNSYSVSATYPDYFTLVTNFVASSDTTLMISLVKDSYLRVIDRATKEPIKGVNVRSGNSSFYSNDNGMVTIQNLQEEILIFRAEHRDYFTVQDSVTLISGDTLIVELSRLLAGIEFQVMDDSEPVSDQTVQLGPFSLTTDQDGLAKFISKPAHKVYHYSIEGACFVPVVDSFFLESDTTILITLEPDAELPEINIETLGDTIQITSIVTGELYVVPPGTGSHVDSIRVNTLITIPLIINESIKVNINDMPGGEYWIYVIDHCDNVSEELTQMVGHPESTPASFRIFPNPVNNTLNVELYDLGNHTINFTSLNGQIILSKEMEGTTLQIDLSSFQKGVYFITIRSKEFVTTRKIIKL